MKCKVMVIAPSLAFLEGCIQCSPAGSSAQDILLEWMNIFIQCFPHPNSGGVYPFNLTVFSFFQKALDIIQKGGVMLGDKNNYNGSSLYKGIWGTSE